MTVENQIPYQSYTANGDQTDFALGFYVEDKGNFFVKQNDMIISKDDYVFNSSTNSISFLTKPTANTKIEVERVTSADRSLTYATYNNSFRPEVLNHDIDRIWRKLQELAYNDTVVFVKLAREISDRVAQDQNLQRQINTLDGQVATNTQEIKDLINNLTQEIAERIQADNILKDMFLSIVDEAINEGTVNALAITHVQDPEKLESITNKWDERTIYVKNQGLYQYDAKDKAWNPTFYSAENIKDGLLTQKEINHQQSLFNDKAITTINTINDLANLNNIKNGTCIYIKDIDENYIYENLVWKPIIINVVNLKSFPRLKNDLDDTQRFKRAINSIQYTTASYPPSGVTSVTVTSLYIPYGEYVISDSLVLNPYIQVISNEMPTIKQTSNKDIFIFNDSYSNVVSGIRFFNGRSAISFNNKNLDETIIRVENCEFHRTSSYAIYTIGTAEGSNHLSALLNINNCKFSLCNKVLHNVCDKTIFSNSWVYLYLNNFEVDSAAIMNLRGTLEINSILGVPNLGSPTPYWGNTTRVANTRWIDNYGVLYCSKCRFGMEADGLTIVHSFGGAGDLLNGMGSSITLRDCQISGSNQQILGNGETGVIRIRQKLPRKIIIENCTYQFETPSIVLNNNYDFISYLNTLVTDQTKLGKYLSENIHISIRNNEKTLSSNVIDIPPILSQFVNNGQNISEHKKTIGSREVNYTFCMPIGANGAIYEFDISSNTNQEGSPLYSFSTQYKIIIGTGYDGANMSFYIQGAQENLGTVPTAIVNSGNDLTFSQHFGTETTGTTNITNDGIAALRFFTLKINNSNNVDIKTKLIKVH